MTIFNVKERLSRHPKSVLLVANGYPSPDKPWKCPFNHRAVKGLQDVCEITVLSVRAWAPWRRPNKYTYDSVTVTELLVPFFPLKLCSGILGQFRLKRVIDAASIFFVERQIQKYVIGKDLIHSVAIGLHSFASQRVASGRGIPCVVQLIGGDVTCLDSTVAMSESFQSWVKNVSQFIANSRSLADSFEHVTEFKPKIEVIYRGVDPNVFFPGASSARKEPSLICTFLYLGGHVYKQFDQRGVDQKGADVLLRAWQKVENDSSSSLKLIVGGPMIEQEGFKFFQDSLIYPDRVECLGSLAAHEISHLLQRVDVLIIPSRKEGMPNVCLEAMASGVPVVAASVGGLPEVISSGIDGVLVPPEEPVTLASAISYLGRDPAIRRRMGELAREKIELTFDSSNYSSDLMSTYMRVLRCGLDGIGGSCVTDGE